MSTISFREMHKEYGDESTREILAVGQKGSPLVQELFKNVVKEDLNDEDLLHAVNIDYVNKLEEAEAVSFNQEIKGEEFTGQSTSYTPVQYVKGIIIHRNEYKKIEKMVLGNNIVALEQFMKGKILPLADSLYRGIERDLLLQKAVGKLGFDSLGLMSGCVAYNGLDGTSLEFWRGHQFTNTETMDKLIKYEDSQSISNAFLKEENKHSSEVGKTTPSAIKVVGSNIFSLYERSLNRTNIPQIETGHPDILSYRGQSIVRITHPSWQAKKNVSITIGKNTLKLKANTKRVMPVSFESFKEKKNTTDAYEFIAIIDAVLGVRMRTGLSIATYTGISADKDI